ncbi:phosphoribosylformylglycinamidine (FGAM) synthase, synthetase domain [Cenarchaeum symbiosum A]|uniref:Phosphoribosylformylglycinamidine synthase subunit PurL n=1 Tax=Cenarchaeum symbiosum (strain A) TaxID=414004 RepID=A0RYV3_CENSY|nr:phosphoribosylformylglycinamidine (FGAM) synthase, synthetase domain [Cenarchaeum symbiosum A]
MSLTGAEARLLREQIGRSPTGTEESIVAAEWSEHCSYKSSRLHLGELPREGERVIRGSGLDSGVLDVGDGYVVTVHIESHNHPSAVEPYGGAATGVGGVVRDILSAGTRPVAILDGLRFGDIASDPHARWLLRGAISGISDYGNCIGVPTIGGEVGFDPSYKGYAIVDVAAIGFGKRENLVRNRAAEGDDVVLVGGPTGMDGVGGAQFASDQLDSDDRSAVQIPDPFMEKLVIEAVLEAARAGLIHAMKDLGGGGLACALSETADSLSVGIEADIGRVHTREGGMRPHEIMVSESQERMLIITPPEKSARLADICAKFGVPCSVIGSVKSGGALHITHDGTSCAELPAKIVANAKPVERKSLRPAYLDRIKDDGGVRGPALLTDTLERLLGSPNIASKERIYGRYDHEVGIRTVLRPGHDAAVLRLDNGKFLAAKMDGNPGHCYLDPRNGAAGCFEEACRNVACTGATPIGMVDHLQFGSPEDPGVFWTFLESLHGISEYARGTGIPCVGGKVSFYNETERGPIKPTPVIGVFGLAENMPAAPLAKDGDALVIIGDTADEMGGSEYLEYIHGFTGGRVPRVDLSASQRNMGVVSSLVGQGLARAHDCSKGGLGVAVSEMCIQGGTGCRLDLDTMPHKKMPGDRVLFSETHSRYVLAVRGPGLPDVLRVLDEKGVPYGTGGFGGESISLSGAGASAELSVDKARGAWRGPLEAI